MSDFNVLYGWHSVIHALSNSRRNFIRLLVTENSAAHLAEELGDGLRVIPKIVRPIEITRLLNPDAVHQGIYLEAEPLVGLDLNELPAQSVLLALDQITDPHNVGAILRTAAAFNVTGIVTTVRHAPVVTAVLAKSASGGLEYVPFVYVRNLAETLISLADQGYMRVGLDSEAMQSVDDVKVTRPLVIVLGAEGKGLRERTRKCCDVLVKIPFSGAIRSLNVSNAAAISLYALVRSFSSADSEAS